MQSSESATSIELHGTVKLKYSEFSKIPYDGLGHHLLNGKHVITPAPGTKHQTISNYVSFKLTEFILSKQLGKVFSSPIDVKFSEKDGYQPDILYIEKENEDIIKDKIIAGSPSLIIEICQDSANADYGWKKKLAEIYQVQEYWVIDLKCRIVEVISLENDKLISKNIYEQSDIIKSNLKIFEDFSLSLDEYF